MTPTLSWVPVLRIDLNFISHSNRDFTHIFIPWDESWWFTSTVMSCVPQISQKTSCLKFSPKFPHKVSQKISPKFQSKNFCNSFAILAPISTPKKPSFLRLAWPTWSRRPWLWRNLQATSMVRGKNIRMGWSLQKKNRSRRKMGSFFSFYFCIARRSFFWKLGPGVYYSEVNFNLYMI